MVVWFWIGFIVFVLLMLALDLGVLNRKARVVPTRQALIWSGFCALLALGFSVFVYFLYEWGWMPARVADGRVMTGKDAAIQFLTGWLIEQSLSLDNIFVIALIFAYFRVPREYQHRTLFWGVLGALVMRGVMIGAGVALIKLFHWVLYFFGALLIYTAFKMLRANEDGVEPERNPLVRLARRWYPVSPDFVGEHFFTMLDGRRAITPLFLVLLVVESTDVIFAVDSIPAVFAVTLPWYDPFIIFTSNVFAILNLRSLYFALAGLLAKFRYLKYSLVFVLFFVGAKMLLEHFVQLSPLVSLGVIALSLLAGVVVSLLAAPAEAPVSPGGTDGPTARQAEGPGSPAGSEHI